MDQNGEILEEERDVPFRRFDVVSDESDHYYLNINRPGKNNTDCFSNAASGVYIKIMKEWKILEKNLPDSICVRAYERRIDLLRAVIVGAAGTPYHDGLFFFDVAFPWDYPAHPPQVYYWSFGLQLNPNLYTNGRVCLSLLNTWAGKKSEKWDPSQSTVLQVLVSLQGLVLNEKPYYNEPGIGVIPVRALWEKHSVAYSEHVFALSCRTMLCLLQKPPKNFEAFVASHFRERAAFILEACNAYSDGCVRVGYFRGDYSSSSSSSPSFSPSEVQVSTTFRSSIQKLFPQLVQSFSENGAPVGTFVEQVNQKESKNSQAAGKKKDGLAKKLVDQLKKILEQSKISQAAGEKKGGLAEKVIDKLKKILGLKQSNGSSRV